MSAAPIDQQRRDLALLKVALIVAKPAALGMSEADQNLLATSIEGIDRTLAWIESNMTQIRAFIAARRIETGDVE